MIDWRRYVPNANVSNAVATLISAVATALLVAVGIWGVCETKKTLELSERAWVSFTAAQLTQPLQADEAIHFGVNLTNSGREPAAGLVFAIQNSVIDAYDARFTSMDEVSVPPNTACANLNPINGRFILAPNGATTWNLDTLHGDPQLRVDERITDGSKYYVVNGCVAYETFGGPHRSSFCYVLARAPAYQMTLPPNIVITAKLPLGQNLAATQGIAIPPSQQQTIQGPLTVPAGTVQTQIGFAYVFNNCASGFDAN